MGYRDGVLRLIVLADVTAILTNVALMAFLGSVLGEAGYGNLTPVVALAGLFVGAVLGGHAFSSGFDLVQRRR